MINNFTSNKQAVSQLPLPRKLFSQAFLNWRPVLAALAVVTLLNGCGRNQSQPPTYNRLPTQSIEELAAALDEENPEIALAYLDRLRAFSSEDLMVNLLIAKEQNRLLVHRLDNLLAAGRMQEARETAHRHVQVYDATNFTEQVLRILHELSLLEEYSALPATDSETMLQRLMATSAQFSELADRPLLAAWRTEQQRIIAEVREQEIDRAAQAITRNIATALATGGHQLIPDMLDDLRILRPHHPLLELRQRLQQLPTLIFSFPDPLLKNLNLDPIENSELPLVLEVAWLLEWQIVERADSVFKDRLLKFLQDTPPASAAGWDLRSRLAAELGHLQTALIYNRRFREAGGQPDFEFLKNIVESSSPADSSLVAEWLAPFTPAVADLIEIIIQRRGSDGTKID